MKALGITLVLSAASLIPAPRAAAADYQACKAGAERAYFACLEQCNARFVGNGWSGLKECKNGCESAFTAGKSRCWQDRAAFTPASYEAEDEAAAELTEL